jgi:hypothetical protein
MGAEYGLEELDLPLIDWAALVGGRGASRTTCIEHTFPVAPRRCARSFHPLT